MPRKSVQKLKRFINLRSSKITGIIIAFFEIMQNFRVVLLMSLNKDLYS